MAEREMNEIRRDIYRVFRKMSVGPNQSLNKHTVLSRRRQDKFSADEISAELERMVREGYLRRGDRDPDHFTLTPSGYRESLTA